nr:PREDICTED: uncharacterized protein LOC105669608 [Linepithema humile]
MFALQGLNYFHLERKYSDNDNRVQKRKEFPSETTEDEAEDEKQEIDENQKEEDVEIQKVNTKIEGEEEENKDEQEDTQIGECAICRTIINETNLGGSVGDSEQNSEGYLLCLHCVQKFSIRSGAEHLQSRRSYGSFSQDRSNDLGDCVRLRRTYDSPMYLQSPSHPLELRRDQWACSRTTMSGESNNEAIDCEKSCGRQRYGYRNLTRRNDVDRYASEIKVKSSSLPASADCSRRPIRCPRLDCSVNVAFSALTHHFLFDHPEVPILSVEPGTKSTLIISYGALSCNSSRCLALLLVSGKLSDSAARLFGGNQVNAKYRNRLPLPVLAARLHSNRSYANCEEVHAGGEGQCEKDVIIAWVAGLDVSDTADKLRCSIQAVDNIENGGFRSLTYTGPVTSLRAAQCPRDVFLAGDCIVLHEGLIGHITSGCTSLNVNVIVH